MNTIGKRIKALRVKRKMKQWQLAEQIGVNTATISKWETGEQEPSSGHFGALSTALGTTADFLVGKATTNVATPVGKTFEVVGEVQAGVWREAIEFEPGDRDKITAILPPEYRDLVINAYVVRGLSMNMYYPSGTHVLVASTIANGLKPKSGQKVMVSRRNRDGLYEATIKEFVVGEDGKRWLWPRSTSPEHQAPIQYNGDSVEEVTITGIVAIAQITESLF